MSEKTKKESIWPLIQGSMINLMLIGGLAAFIGDVIWGINATPILIKVIFIHVLLRHFGVIIPIFEHKLTIFPKKQGDIEENNDK